MKLYWKVIVVVLIFGVPAFLTGRTIWPPSTEMSPTSAQIPFFIILSIFEALSFGLGVSFLTFGWKYVKKLFGKDRKMAFLVYASSTWQLINWWPHDNFHAHNGSNMQGLLYIEYGFHVTLIISAAIIAYGLLRLSRENR